MRRRGFYFFLWFLREEAFCRDWAVWGKRVAGWSLQYLIFKYLSRVSTLDLMGQKNGGWLEGVSLGFRSLVRRKQVDNDSVHSRKHQLAKELSAPQLIAIGVGSTIGAGVYVLVGTLARQHSGLSLTISFLIAGIAAALSAFCHAELASRCPSAGSAYHYSYICIGEGVAWLIGWALILEYTIGGSAVARGISPILALFFGGKDGLPAFLGHVHIPWLDVVVDPAAAILVLIVTGLLCTGIKESSLAQAIVTSANVCVMIFVIITGGFLGFQTGWVGYAVPNGYFPYGVNGMLAGSATVFFAFIGFDTVASTAEEVKNPRRDLPLGIGVALLICCLLYMLLSVVIVGLVPYYSMDLDNPISSAFSSHGMQWAMYVITAGVVTALCSTLMGSMLPQPRVLMAMGRDGLLPPFFSDVNRSTQVPTKSTLVAGLFAASLAFFMDVSQLAGMVSVGTLLAFTIVAVSIVILRYVPPDEMPFPISVHQSIDCASLQCDPQENEGEESTDGYRTCNDANRQLQGNILDPNDVEVSVSCPLTMKEVGQENIKDEKRRRVAALNIIILCIGVVLITSAASAEHVITPIRLSVCTAGGLLLLCSLLVLSWIDQDDGRHSFGHRSAGTWIRVSLLLLIGVFVYLFYGRTHGSLAGAIYVATANAEEI